MSATIKRCVPYGLVAIASVWLLSTVTASGDWTGDSWPAVNALGQGHLSDYLSSKAMMGTFATVVQTPFAAAAGGDGLHTYRWAALPCLLAAGFLGLYLAAVAGRRGASRPTQALIAALCLLNPLSREALMSGHPEEILTAALAVGAVATASEGHNRRTAVLLGLAIASKQWAVIAILPVLLALPARKLAVGLGAAGVVATLMLPSVVAAPGAFSEVSHNAAQTGRVVTPWSVWYPLATTRTQEVDLGTSTLTAEVADAPTLVGSFSHPLIVLLAFALPLAMAFRRGRLVLPGAEAMALLALLALLRCALDPVDNLYYHAPLLLALIGWDALDPHRLPLRSLAAAAFALLFWDWSLELPDFSAYNVVYLSVIGAAGLAIGATLFRPGPALVAQGEPPKRRPSWGGSLLRQSARPEFSRDEARISGIKSRRMRPMKGQ